MIVGDDAIVRGDQKAARWIKGARHVFPRNDTLPFIVSGPAGDRQPAIESRATWHHGSHEISDPPGGISSDQIVIDQTPAPRCLIERIDVSGAQHRQQAIERQIEVRELYRP